jgi:hypothetical protein
MTFKVSLPPIGGGGGGGGTPDDDSVTSAKIVDGAIVGADVSAGLLATISDAQADATQALADASTVSTGLSTHIADTGNPHVVTAAQAGAVPTARMLTAGNGLTGGGDLSADRSFAVLAADGSISVGAGGVALGNTIPNAREFTGVITLSAAATALSVTNNVSVGGVVTHTAGTVSAPTITRLGDLDTGIYFPGAGDQLAITCNGTQILLCTDTLVSVVNTPLRVTDGTAANPALGFITEPDCGFYISTTNTIGCSTNGVSRFTVSTTTLALTTVIALPQGSVGSPCVTATGDSNTGAYFTGPDGFALTAGGTQRIHVNATGIGLYGVVPVARQDITGSRAGGAALTDLLTKLALTGIITDSTTV